MTSAEIAAQRAAVIAEAATWLGTPFANNQSVKGAGVDCAHFLAAVYVAAGVAAPMEIENYSPQWFLHRDEERFLSYVVKVTKEIDEGQAGQGDIVMYKIGRCFAHGALIVDWPNKIVHAHMQSGRVLASRPFDGDLRNCKTRFFSPWAA